MHFLTAGLYAQDVPHAELQFLLTLCSQSSSPRLARQGIGAKESWAAVKRDIYEAPVPSFQNQPWQSSLSMSVEVLEVSGLLVPLCCSCPSDIAPFPPVHLGLKCTRLLCSTLQLLFVGGCPKQEHLHVCISWRMISVLSSDHLYSLFPAGS